MITSTALESYTAKDLAQMAKRKGVLGWHSMRKSQLIKALTDLNKHDSGRKGSGKSRQATKPEISEVDRKPPRSRRTSKRIEAAHRRNEERKEITTPTAVGESHGDRIALMVRDPFWLHAYWEISSQAILRVRAAMAEQWHTAEPVIRVLKSSSSSTTSTAEVVDRDIRIHGGVNNWYIDVEDPPKTFRVEIGYLARTGRFFGIARSNSVTTPRSTSSDVDHNWTDVASDCERILAQSGAFSEEGNDGELQRLFEERLKRPIGSPMMTRYGVGAESILERERNFTFEVDAEMIVFGATQPDAHVTLGGEPVRVRPDGTFTLRMCMNEGRQVIPVVSSSNDGMHQQTIILAVERNTKAMEPVARDSACN